MLAKKIRKARKEALYTQKELGEKIGVSDKAISAYEVGRANPPLKVLLKLAKALGRSLESFYQKEPGFEVMGKLKRIEKELLEIKTYLKKRQRLKINY